MMLYIAYTLTYLSSICVLQLFFISYSRKSYSPSKSPSALRTPTPWNSWLVSKTRTSDSWTSWLDWCPQTCWLTKGWVSMHCWPLRCITGIYCWIWLMIRWRSWTTSNGPGNVAFIKRDLFHIQYTYIVSLIYIYNVNFYNIELPLRRIRRIFQFFCSLNNHEAWDNIFFSHNYKIQISYQIDPGKDITSGQPIW